MKVGEHWMGKAAEVARRATCRSDLCGAVLVRDGVVLGEGCNGPAPGTEPRCGRSQPSALKPKSDRTCCVHAEWRAILAAVDRVGRPLGKGLGGSTLFFTRVGRVGTTSDPGPRLPSGLPYCTVCSRLALEAGVGTWVLDHGGTRGLVEYPAALYDELSHEFDLLVAWQSGQRVAKLWTELPSPLWLQEDAEGRVE